MDHRGVQQQDGDFIGPPEAENTAYDTDGAPVNKQNGWPVSQYPGDGGWIDRNAEQNNYPQINEQDPSKGRPEIIGPPTADQVGDETEE